MLDTFKRENSIQGRKRLHCGQCERFTIHNLEARCSGNWSIPEIGEGGGEHYSIYRCGACDAICYETVSWDSFDYELDEDNEPFHSMHAVQYPAPVSAHFCFNTEAVPAQLASILNEMLYALAGSKMVLATIGLRLVLEFIVNDNKCAGGNLAKKIDSLRTKDHIDDDQKEMLHRIRELGNEGAHDAKGMNANELIAGMSIIEGLLEKLYNGPARHAATIKRAKLLFSQT